MVTGEEKQGEEGGAFFHGTAPGFVFALIRTRDIRPHG